VTPPVAAALPGARAGERARSRLHPRPPRRVSGPARQRRGTTAPRARPLRAEAPLLAAAAALERLSSHRLLDRLIRGRAWLVLLTFALIGVVTLQLALLKLNGGVGRTLATEQALQRENASLSIENSELASADRVQARAAALGMEFASSSALRSLAPAPQLDFSHSVAALASGSRAQSAGASTEEGGSQGAARGAGSGSEAGETQQSSGPQAGGTGEGSSESQGSAASSSPPSPAGGEASAQTSAGSAQQAEGPSASSAQSGGQAGPSG
jgi:cell division protein FtsL